MGSFYDNLRIRHYQVEVWKWLSWKENWEMHLLWLMPFTLPTWNMQLWVSSSQNVPPPLQTSFLSSCFFGWWLEFCAQTARQCPGLLFFVRVKLASFLLWLAGCQVPKPHPNPTTPPPHTQPKLQLQTPPILKRAETYNGNFQGLSTQERAPTRPVTPTTIQTPPPTLPPCGPCSLPCLESKGIGSSWKVKCSLSALSWKSSQTPPTPPVWNIPENTTSFTWTQKCLRVPQSTLVHET